MAKRAAAWVKCNGEAHRNAYIDNCGVCMPFWGSYPVCPDCHNSLKRNARGLFGKTAECRFGHGRFAIDERNRTELSVPKWNTPNIGAEPCRKCGNPEKLAAVRACAPCLAAGTPSDYNGPQHHAHRDWSDAQAKSLGEWLRAATK